MGPKRGDNASRNRRMSQVGSGMAEEQENQQCVGKFAADLELCCREPPLTYPVNIPVYNRNHRSSSTMLIPPISRSGASGAASVMGVEEQTAVSMKRPSRGRLPSISHNVILTGIDNDNKSVISPGQEPAPTSYKTFHLVRDSEFYQPKLLADPIGNENEPIDQINTLFMRAWQLDQRFIEILKKILPLQDQLHTLNFCFVGLNERTIQGLVELCPLIKKLKTVSLDGNPLAAECFHILLEKDDIKITNLSLRFCKITDQAADRLANALGTMSNQNSRLLTLTLTGNQIGDNGAKSFAKALRYNRTLISLNLSLNFITDKGACALASILRKFSLTHDEIVHRRYLLSERYTEPHPDEMRNITSSPTLSVGSTTKSSREGKRATETIKRPKSITTKDKRHRAESSDDIRPPSASKVDPKKGKTDATTGRSSTVNPHRSTTEQTRTGRGKKLGSSVGNTSKKNISVVKEEDEDVLEELMNLQMAPAERQNPLLELVDIEIEHGEINLKGNLVLLNLNLSRNYLTTVTTNDFLRTVEYQSGLMHFNDVASISSTLTSPIDFSGLCRLELKGMTDLSHRSPTYQALERLLLQKSPILRIQQFKEREAKELLDQQQLQQQLLLQQQAAQASQPIAPERPRASSSVKSMNHRPISRLRE